MSGPGEHALDNDGNVEVVQAFRRAALEVNIGQNLTDAEWAEFVPLVATINRERLAAGHGTLTDVAVWRIVRAVAETPSELETIRHTMLPTAAVGGDPPSRHGPNIGIGWVRTERPDPAAQDYAIQQVVDAAEALDNVTDIGRINWQLHQLWKAGLRTAAAKIIVRYLDARFETYGFRWPFLWSTGGTEAEAELEAAAEHIAHIGGIVVMTSDFEQLADNQTIDVRELIFVRGMQRAYRRAADAISETQAWTDAAFGVLQPSATRTRPVELG